jgi:hypothetical protein
MKPLSPIAMILLVACSGGSAGEPDPPDAGASSAGSGGAGGASGTGGVDASAGGGGGGPAPVTWPQACADIYDPEVLPTFELVFTPQEWAGVQSDCSAHVQQYRPVQFVYGGETASAMVRLKGNWSWNCEKMQFVVSFNESDTKARFHGLRKVVLDAPWYDRTMMHERLAFPLFKERGLPYSCVNNAKLMVNGQYYGLYANVERLDKEYLQRHFEQADGNLYEGGAELETNEDTGDTSDIEALNAAATVEEIAALVDLDQAVAEWATEAMLPAMDNYWAGVEINYFLYHHPSRGFLYLPYDLDISFGDSAHPNGDLIWPDSVSADPITYQHPQWHKEDLAKKVLSDATWCGRFVEELKLARAAYNPTELAAQVDIWDAQIGQALADDPNKTFTTEGHKEAVAQLKAFFGKRAAFVDQWLASGDHCPATF